MNFEPKNVITQILQSLYNFISTLELLPEHTRDFINLHMPILDEITVSLIGLQILLLCVLTLEHRLNMSRHFYFKPKGQTCMRIFLTLTAISLVIASFTLSFLIQRTNLIWSEDESDDLLNNIVIYTTYLMVYACLPIFIIVIVGKYL